jgi:predicted enzyme related to lactoylglutathione lyase
VNLNSILMGSEDAPRLVEYYTKVLGNPSMSDSSYTTWTLGDGALSIGPHSEVHGKSDQPGRLILNIESDDVKADFARMRDAGAVVIREPYNFDEYPDYWIATLADPDGNYFQLVTPFDATQRPGQG